MNPSNTPETNLPTMVEPPSLPVKAAISPEEMGKALQLRHENRLTVRKPILPDLLEAPTDGGYTIISLRNPLTRFVRAVW